MNRSLSKDVSILLLANFQEGDVSNEGIEHNSPNNSDQVIFSGYLPSLI